jgi:preprotein translocase subunit SecA
MKELEDSFAIGRSDFFRHSLEYVRDNGPQDDAFTQMEDWFAPGEGEGEDEAPAPSEQEFGTPVINPTRMIGRNDPCPCGSGKKFKKCCGAAG